MEKIALLGCGSWGSALAQGLAENGHTITAWHYNPDLIIEMTHSRAHHRLENFSFHENIQFEPNLHHAINNHGIIIAAVPSHAIRETMEQAKTYFSTDVIIVNVAKGVENKTLETMSIVIHQATDLDPKNIVSLYGPSHAEEVIKGHPTTLVSASSEEKSAKKIQKIFSSDLLRVYTNLDIRGVELGGSLKNVIAIAVGICDAIGFGDNTKAALITRGLAEITRLGEAMGANSDTFYGLSGIGDLIATCLSKHSRNRYVGEEIGKGKSLAIVLDEMNMIAEGVKTTRSVHDLSIKYQIEMPISEGVFQILFNEKDPKHVVSQLMTRDLRQEKIFS